MPRGIPNNKATPSLPNFVAQPAQQPTQPGLEARLQPTTLHHVYNFDIKGDGRFREVAVVKMNKDGYGRVISVYYIITELLDRIDQGRIKQAVTNIHADKYELWDLFSQITLNNGKNALDYFHQLTRVEHAPGAVNTVMGGGLASVQAESTSMIGAGFTDPASATVNSQTAL